MDKKRLDALLQGFDRLRIAVVGDIFLDRIFYIERGWDELSVETGLVAYQVCRRSCVPGAAGVITNNLHSLQVGQAYAVTVTGDDGEAYDLRKGLRDTGIDTAYMVSEEGRFTPTYTKTFFDEGDSMEETHRIDLKNRGQMSAETERRIIEHLLALEEKVDAFVCLEQLTVGHWGVFTEPVIETLAAISKRGKARVLVDSRHNLRRFHDMVVKCNDNELLRAADIQAELDGVMDAERTAAVEGAMTKLAAQSDFPMFVTCGQAGIKVFSEGEVRTVPAYRVEGPVDICGAGDSALCGIACALCAGASLEEAALLGNLVASIIVQQIGVTGTATRAQVAARWEEYEKGK